CAKVANGRNLYW
nr:immunoglobulin heavy chain junction region [Macaca mulatta]MOY24977.1 immunoglobulin heavy chain junction region [Macaca mulatta]MOY26522.1 immunoglobulin heavy chain junction region [Macaca mulatta]